MTVDQMEWLAQKRLEFTRCQEIYAVLGHDISTWDLTHFIRIIDDREREIRKLKTENARLKR